jgi:hypothetical protein
MSQATTRKAIFIVAFILALLMSATAAFGQSEPLALASPSGAEYTMSADEDTFTLTYPSGEAVTLPRDVIKLSLASMPHAADGSRQPLRVYHAGGLADSFVSIAVRKGQPLPFPEPPSAARQDSLEDLVAQIQLYAQQVAENNQALLAENTQLADALDAADATIAQQASTINGLNDDLATAESNLDDALTVNAAQQARIDQLQSQVDATWNALAALRDFFEALANQNP